MKAKPRTPRIDAAHLQSARDSIRSSVASIFEEVEGIDFEQTQQQFLRGCQALHDHIQSAPAATTFDGQVHRALELDLLACRLGFHSGPMLLRTDRSPDDPELYVFVAVFTPAFGGFVREIPIAAYKMRNDESTLCGMRVPLSDADRAVICSCLRDWECRADAALPASFRADLAHTDRDLRFAEMAVLDEMIRGWHLPSHAMFPADCAPAASPQPADVSKPSVKRGDDDRDRWRAAEWFDKATEGATTKLLVADTLRKAGESGRVQRRKSGGRWQYEIESVCAAYPHYESMIRSAALRESTRG